MTEMRGTRSARIMVNENTRRAKRASSPNILTPRQRVGLPSRRRELQQSVQSIEVVNDAPVATALLHPRPPLLESSEVLARVEVVGA